MLTNQWYYARSVVLGTTIRLPANRLCFFHLLQPNFSSSSVHPPFPTDGLCGIVKALASAQVKFQPPRLTLSGLIDLPIGPQSSVVLTTTYLTPTVRLGKGSRGSLFVFTKGGAADTACKPCLEIAVT